MSHLDALLGEWAESRRLSAGEADAVRLAVVGEPPGLPAMWWGDFNDRMSRIMVQATGSSLTAPGGAAVR